MSRAGEGKPVAGQCSSKNRSSGPVWDFLHECGALAEDRAPVTLVYN